MNALSTRTLATLAALTMVGMVACGGTSKTTSADGGGASPAKVAEGEGSPAKKARIGPKAPQSEGKLAYAYLAGGCFWGVEHYLEKMEGVKDVVSGYMGGHVANPTYRQVVGKKTGHLEAVKVSYYPDKVSYEAVAKMFFEIHDPTQKNGQGPDIGPQYLSAVFYSDDAEKKTVNSLIARLEKKGLSVATQVRPVDGPFYAAEDYHQDYYVKTGKYPYCHKRVKRFDN